MDEPQVPRGSAVSAPEEEQGGSAVSAPLSSQRQPPDHPREDPLYRLLLDDDSSVRASPSPRKRSRSRTLARRIHDRRLSRAPSGRDLRRMLEDSEQSKGEHEEFDGDGDVFQS